MYARKIQVRAALLLVLSLAVIAAFSSAAASAAKTVPCDANPYTQAGRLCIEQQARSQASVVEKSHHKVANKHSSSQCPDPLYSMWLRCR